MKFKDNLANNKFDLIQKDLEDLNNEKKEIIDKTLTNSMVLDTLIPKTDNLKRDVCNY